MALVSYKVAYNMEEKLMLIKDMPVVKDNAKSEMGSGRAPVSVKVKPQAKTEMGGVRSPVRIR